MKEGIAGVLYAVPGSKQRDIYEDWAVKVPPADYIMLIRNKPFVFEILVETEFGRDFKIKRVESDVV